MDIIETYVIATIKVTLKDCDKIERGIRIIIKLIGWAGVGALAVFKQNLVENLDEHKEKPVTYAQNYTIPRYLKVLMTYKIQF